jgi:CDP-diacylglycerol--glycerol-3-phosphate 3-phosphatidyltransferase
MATTNLTLPNMLSGLRILLVPVLLGLAWLGHASAFLLLLAVSLSTDFFDGYLARRLDQSTELGVKLDSWGDLLTYGVMVVGLYLLWPGTFDRESWFLAMGVAFYLLPTFASLYKFRDLPRYHTWAAKAAALLLAPAYYLLTLWDLSLPFRVVIVFHVWVAVEEVLITLTLKRKQDNVPSWLHARFLTRRARERLRNRRNRIREARAQRRDRFRHRPDQ